MLHTIHPTRPILDSQVNKALDLQRTAYCPGLEKRIKWDGEILNAEDLFIALFSEAFGAETAGYLYS